ncbi:hypothetical protein [Streptomyces sp. AS13]|uniref:hypothetical protein n=1 Tax=Streptomyces sp. AS13 TaxID=3038080 RepID=UPI00278BCDBA|nr:hypothetical protein [Streptomyces sp. AS13]
MTARKPSRKASRKSAEIPVELPVEAPAEPSAATPATPALIHISAPPRPPYTPDAVFCF